MRFLKQEIQYIYGVQLLSTIGSSSRILKVKGNEDQLGQRSRMFLELRSGYYMTIILNLLLASRMLYLFII